MTYQEFQVLDLSFLNAETMHSFDLFIST